MHPESASVRLPAASLATLSHRCGALGSEGREALREAGRVAGRAVHRRLDPDENALGFWQSVDRELREAGLGRLSYRVLNPDVASVELAGLPEAEVDGPRSSSAPRGCHFFTGLLGGLLSLAGEEAVAVLEVECRANGGGPSCRFLIGAEERLWEIHERLSSGAPLPEVLEGS